MTFLFMDGFDVQDTTTKWINSMSGPQNPPTFTASTRFGAGYAMQVPGTGNVGERYYVTRSFTASAHAFVGAAVKPVFTSGQHVPFFILGSDNSATCHLYLNITSLGAVGLWRGDGRSLSPSGTLLGTSANGVVSTDWHYMELGAVISDTVGAAVVKVDNSTVITFSGDTRNGGTSTDLDTLVHFAGKTDTSTVMPSAILDDLYICNALGGVNDTFLGDMRIQTCSPSGAGSSTALTPTGSGTNYLNVNEVPDDTATYNGSATPGDRDTYALANLASGTGTIYAVQQVMTAFKTGAGSASLKAAQKSGATVSYGATQSLGTSPAVYLDVFETNPATSAAYTATEVNALEAGAEVA